MQLTTKQIDTILLGTLSNESTKKIGDAIGRSRTFVSVARGTDAYQRRLVLVRRGVEAFLTAMRDDKETHSCHIENVSM